MARGDTMNLVLPAYLAKDEPAIARQIVHDWLSERFPDAIEKPDDIPDGWEHLLRISENWHIDPATVNYWARKGVIDAEKHKITIIRSVGSCGRWVWFANRAAVEGVLEGKGYKRKNVSGTL